MVSGEKEKTEQGVNFEDVQSKEEDGSDDVKEHFTNFVLDFAEEREVDTYVEIYKARGQKIID